MDNGGAGKRLLRFGVFELDAEAGELRKSGVRVKLHEQPFHVLVYLLQRPGQVVTREDLQKALWPSGTFVDFDHGLYSAINKIREVWGTRRTVRGSSKPSPAGDTGSSLL
jgi:cholera toxin transcriptional activator